MFCSIYKYIYQSAEYSKYLQDLCDNFLIEIHLIRILAIGINFISFKVWSISNLWWQLFLLLIGANYISIWQQWSFCLYLVTILIYFQISKIFMHALHTSIYIIIIVLLFFLLIFNWNFFYRPRKGGKKLQSKRQDVPKSLLRIMDLCDNPNKKKAK